MSLIFSACCHFYILIPNMPGIQGAIDFLADIELYKFEKPFAALVSPGTQVTDDQLNNLQWETHNDIVIDDIRGREDQFTLENCGFQLLKSPARNLSFAVVEDIENYKRETEVVLGNLLGASSVYCWEARV